MDGETTTEVETPNFDSAKADRVADLLEYLCDITQYKPPEPKNDNLEQMGFFVGCCFPGCIGWLLLVLAFMNESALGLIATSIAMVMCLSWWLYSQHRVSDGEHSPAYAEFKEMRTRLAGKVDASHILDLIYLCQGMVSWGRTVVPAAATTEALPLIGPEHMASFNDNDRLYLCELTSRHFPYELRLAAIQALEHVGRGDAVRMLSALANDNKANIKLRAEAKRVLPILQAREATERPSRTLLRAADSTGQEQLLRPAGNSQSDPSDLLRPMDEESPVDQPNQQT
jgi:hypothetical protein